MGFFLNIPLQIISHADPCVNINNEECPTTNRSRLCTGRLCDYQKLGDQKYI